jgi:hypothetical protein
MQRHLSTIIVSLLLASSLARGQQPLPGPEGSWQRLPITAISPSPYPDNAQGLVTPVEVPGAEAFRLHLEYVDLEQGFDFLRIYDGAGDLVVEYTGQQREVDSPVIKGDRARLELYSDYSNSGRGFRVSHVEALLSAPTTGPRWVEEMIDVRSPSPYANNLVQEAYPVRRPGAKSLRLYFDFIDMEDHFDFLEIIDGSGATAAIYTGAHSGFWTEPIVGDRLIVALTTDFSEARRGFAISRLQAYVAGGAAPPTLASVEYFLGDRDGQVAGPVPAGVLRLRPRGLDPDRFLLILEGRDTLGQPVPPEQLHATVSVAGEVGTITPTAPARFLFTASGQGGTFGELIVSVPGLSQELPRIPVAVEAETPEPPVPGGPPWGRSRLDHLQVLHRDAGGREQVTGEGTLALRPGQPGRDRMLLRIQGVDRGGGDVPLRGDIECLVHGATGVLQVERRGDTEFMVIALQQVRRTVELEFRTPVRRGRQVSTRVRVLVEPEPPRLATLQERWVREGRVLDQIDPRGVVLDLEGEGCTVTITPLDQQGRTMGWQALPVSVEVGGVAEAITIRETSPGRYAITPRAPGRATVAFVGRNGEVRTSPVPVVVMGGHLDRVELLVRHGDQWIPLPGDQLALTPRGRGPAHLLLEVRGVDRRGQPLPPERFSPRVSLRGSRGQVTLHGLGENRYRLQTSATEPLTGVELEVQGPRGRRVLRSVPVSVVLPRPVVTALRLQAQQGGRAMDVTGQAVELRLNGAREFDVLDLELVPIDQSGRVMQGVRFTPEFHWEGNVRPGNLRKLSDVPSAWRLTPLLQESEPVTLTVTIQGTTVTADLQISVRDLTLVPVGTQRAAGWVQWGQERDYDFRVPARATLPLARVARLETRGRFRVKNIWVLTTDNQWRRLDLDFALAPGETRQFSLPGADRKIQLVRIHGYSDPGCEIALSLRDPGKW